MLGRRGVRTRNRHAQHLARDVGRPLARDAAVRVILRNVRRRRAANAAAIDILGSTSPDNRNRPVGYAKQVPRSCAASASNLLLDLMEYAREYRIRVGGTGVGDGGMGHWRWK